MIGLTMRFISFGVLAVCVGTSILAAVRVDCRPVKPAVVSASDRPAVNSTIATSFIVNGKLVVGTPEKYRGIIPRVERLYLMRNSRYRLIDSLDKLSGFVRIANAQQALEFVHLRTSRKYFGLFPVSHPEMDIDAPVLGHAGANRKLTSTVVTKTRTGYLIKRPLLRDYDSKLIFVIEFVTSTGSYHQQSRTDLGRPRDYGVTPTFIPSMM